MKFMDDGGGNMESRLDVEVSLAPGFLVTFAGARVLRFPHLREPALSRVKPETLALVDALSAPSSRALGGLIDDLVADEGADRALLLRFAEALADAGQLVTAPLPARHAGAAVTPVDHRIAQDADLLLQIRTPTSLVVEPGTYLWFDHAGVLRARLQRDEVRACMAFATSRTLDAARKVQKRSVP